MGNHTVIQVLEDEISILADLAKQANAKKSVYQKQCAEQMSRVDQEINSLLAKAGVLNDYDALGKKKSGLRKELDNILAEIDSQVEQAQNIVIYLRSRIAALSVELPEEG